MKEIRTLKPSEIEIRVQQVNDKGTGCSLLLYKNARADMEILDETFGASGWQRRHEVINNNLFCTISIWDEDKKEWIDKQDVGTEGNFEKEKSQATDSFKRAAVNVGIGRELYSAPSIWIKLRQNEVEEVPSQYRSNPNSPKYRLNYNVKFFVDSIKYGGDKKITSLVIVDQNGECRYSYQFGNVSTRGESSFPSNLPEPVALRENTFAADNSVNNNLNANVATNTEMNLQDRMKLALNTLIDFGKYRGSTLGYIKQADPQYFDWLSHSAKSMNIKDACDIIAHA